MSITNKVIVGLVSVAFALSLVATHSAFAADEVAQLQSEIAKLLEQIKGLQSTGSSTVSSSSTATPATGSNAACPFSWTRNLSIGSTGDDVRQLQRFLNGNPQTQVAVSGVGSPGNESSYYGPATARAVSKFQEMYAVHILTPLGLTQGTGGFYTSTRTHANSVCQSGSGTSVSVYRTGTKSATTPAVVRVTGDALAVTAGNPISDSYVVRGAQRAPFTSVVLTAGSDDVRIENVRIKRFGLSSSDNFESVALVDANGVQIGTARGLNSRDEVSLGSNFIVPANRSVTLAVIGNMVDDDDEFKSGAIAGLEIAEVVADARVQGTFPIRGAAHVLSDSVDLQSVVVEVGGGGGTINFNEDEEIASINIELDSSGADEEDAYLRSIILEQIGSADKSEVGDIEVFVDNDSVAYTLVVDRDRFIINFSGRGVLIEEDDSVEVSMEINTDSGYEETVQFKIDDVADVYVLGASYGYGLPVFVKGDLDEDNKVDTGETWKDETAIATISSGRVDDGGRLKRFKDEISYGDDVVLGAFSIEFEGEDVEMEDLVFKVELDNYPWTSATENAWVDADEDTVRFDSVRLRIDGENVGYADDSVDFDVPTKEDYYVYVSDDDDERISVEFDGNFVIDVRDGREVIFEIVADLDESWSYFDGTGVEFILVDVDTAEGVNSEKDYTASGLYFASDIDFEDVEIIGNKVTFEISDDGMDGSNFVRGSDDVVFGTLEIDATNAIDDVELRDLYISFQIPTNKVGDLGHLNDCRVLDESGDEIADSRGMSGGRDVAAVAAIEDQTRFRFDDYVVEAEDRVDLDIVCDIDDNAETADEYRIVADTTEDDHVVYRIGRQEDEYALESSDTSKKVVVESSGVLKITTAVPDEDESVIAVAVGGNQGVDNVAVMEIGFEAEKEDIQIIDVYLTSAANFGAKGAIAVPVTENALDDVFDGFTLKLGNTDADTDDYVVSVTFAAADYDNLSSDETITKAIKFDGVHETIQDGDANKREFNLTVDFGGIDSNDGSAGQFLDAASLVVIWEGDDSGVTNFSEHTIATGDFVTALPFPTVPTVSTTATSSDSLKVSGKQKIYEFTVRADSRGDVYLGQVGLDVGLTGATATNMKIYRGADGDGTVRGSKAAVASGVINKVEFTTVELIEAGESRTYSVYADVAVTGSDNHAITVELAHDAKEANSSLGRKYSDVTSAGSFVWSPNSLDKDGAKSDNADWFTSWTLVTDSDTKQWSLERS